MFKKSKDQETILSLKKENARLKDELRIAKDKGRFLDGEMDRKDDAITKQYADWAIIEKATRELCMELISKKQLSLDPDEAMSKQTTAELLKQAKKAHSEYVEDRKDRMLEIQDELDEWVAKYEDLEIQYARLKRSFGNDEEADRREAALQKEYEEAIQREAFLAQNPELASQLEGKQIEKLEDDYEEEAPLPEDPAPTPKKKKEKKVMVVEEDVDAVPSDLDVQQGNERISQTISAPTESSLPAVRSKKNREQAKKAKVQEYITDTKRVAEVAANVTDEGWAILEGMAFHGKTEGKEIVEYAHQRLDGQVSEPTIRRSLQILVKMEIIKTTNASTPFRPKMALFCINKVTGEPVIYEHFGTEKGIEYGKNRITIIEREHDNLTHGLAICDLADALRKTEKYDEVSEFNRRKALKTQNGEIVIPDLIVKRKGERPLYLEYEMGYTTQSDFNHKIDKYRFLSPRLIFVANNSGDVEKLAHQVKLWADTKKQGISNFEIFIANARALTDLDLYEVNGWPVKFAQNPETKQFEMTTREIKND